MRVRARLLQRPKVGESEPDSQDAAAFDGARGLAAVADGATDSALQRLWAHLLVGAWVANPPGGAHGPEVDEWLAQARAAWAAAVPWDSLPWHGSLKAQQVGALATLLGVVATDAQAGGLRIEALAAGDCGLLLLDGDGALRLAWPLASADAFTSTPALLSSLRLPPDDAWERGFLLETTFTLAPGETLLLGTDAVIQWLLRVHAAGPAALAATVAALEAAAQPLCGEDASAPADEADAQIAAARASGHLRNDDVTLLFLALETP